MSANSKLICYIVFTSPLTAFTSRDQGGQSARGSRIAAMLQTVRNVAIILALAAAIDFLPGGGAAAATVLAALTLIFLASIAWLVYRVYREQQLTLATLTDSRRAGLFGAVGGIALLVVAISNDVFDFQGGLVLWIALMAACIAVIFLIWRDATTYS
jgi:hypothetical protein